MPRMASFASRARRALGWGAAAYLGLQVLLVASIECFCPHVTNPEFAERLERIEQAARLQPNRPRVLMVGSSRCLNAFRPEELPPIHTAAGAEVLVFNYAHGGAGPVLNQLLVNRLLREGIAPQWLFLEIMPPYLSHDGEDMFLRVMEARDLPVLRRHVSRLAIYRKYLRNRFVVQQGQTELLRRYVPALLDCGHSVHDEVGDRGGQVFVESTLSLDAVERAMARAREQYVDILSRFRITPTADRALRALLDVCQRKHIGVSLVLMPEGSLFRSWYPKEALEQLDHYLAELRRDYGVAVIDARLWLGDECFYDSHHVYLAGARLFTSRFAREVLEPLAKGGSLVVGHSSFAMRMTND